VQNHTIGRHLMQDVLDRAATRHVLGVRLVHASYHTRALSLYAKLGFTVRDCMARMTGEPLARAGAFLSSCATGSCFAGV
jgi:GNAT superfamily N-acetyltransferase